METSYQNTEIIPDQNMATIAWSDIESTQADDAHDLDEIESFFREDCEHDVLEEPIF